MSFFLSYKEVAKDISSKTDILFKAIQEVNHYVDYIFFVIVIYFMANDMTIFFVFF